jgi:hypothetical protein
MSDFFAVTQKYTFRGVLKKCPPEEEYFLPDTNDLVQKKVR